MHPSEPRVTSTSSWCCRRSEGAAEEAVQRRDRQRNRTIAEVFSRLLHPRQGGGRRAGSLSRQGARGHGPEAIRRARQGSVSSGPNQLASIVTPATPTTSTGNVFSSSRTSWRTKEDTASLHRWRAVRAKSNRSSNSLSAHLDAAIHRVSRRRSQRGEGNPRDFKVSRGAADKTILDSSSRTTPSSSRTLRGRRPSMRRASDATQPLSQSDLRLQ